MVRMATSALTILLLIPGVLMQDITTVGYTGTSTTIDCPVPGDYTKPAWNGPPVVDGSPTLYYDPGSDAFNPVLQNRFTWASNQRSLILTGTRRGDSGQYICGVQSSSLQTGQNNLLVRTKPGDPELTSTAEEDTNGIRATEGKPLTITCTSRGGHPAPSVVLYKGSINGQILAQTHTGTAVGDTYTVTLSYTFTPTRQDDRQQLVCRSYYPTPADAQLSQQKSAVLYMYLKPLDPTVTQTTNIVKEGDVIVQCRTSGSRPSANISWVYQEHTYTPAITVTEDQTKETYTTLSMFRRHVTTADNGQTVRCKITHSTLASAMTASGALNIQFPVGPSSTKITGNNKIIASGSNSLTLTCTTGSSNPAPSITWENGTEVISNNNAITNKTGKYNGVVRSQVLTLWPTRYEHGNTIVCSVSNGVLQVTDTTSVMLNLHFHPIVTISTNSTLTVKEGETSSSTALPCSVDSNPLPNITWYHNNRVTKQATAVSSLSYSITNANRTSYGNYTCEANNGVPSSDKKTYMVEILFRPLKVTLQKTDSVIANGNNPMSIICTSGTSNPVAQITWTTYNIQTSTPTVIDGPGEFGGKVRTSTIRFTPTRKHDGLKVSCEAWNNITGAEKVSTSTVIDNIEYSPLITNISEMIAREGDSAILRCTARSKPPASFTWRKGSTIIAQGTGTSNYNGLNHTIDTVYRNQTGKYTCTANNSIPPYDSEDTNFTVLYPPDIIVSVTNTTGKTPSVTLTCNASGVPDRYTYEPWVHKWNDQVIVHSDPLPNTRELTLSDLTYAHSGVYTCGASNGIKGISHGSGSILVKSIPVITGNAGKSGKIKSSGQLMRPVEVIFQFYSNSNEVSVSVYRNNDRTKEVDVHLRDKDIKLPVFQSEVTTPGTEATIKINLTMESQFGAYEIFVKNEIGTVNLSLVIQPPATSEPGEPSSSIGKIAGGAAGGVATVLVIVAVILFVTLRRKGKASSEKTKDKGALVDSSNENLGFDDKDEVVNRLYESAGPLQNETALTASASKPTSTPDLGADMYAKVQKKPKGKKEQPPIQSTSLNEKDIYALPDKTRGKDVEKPAKQNPQKILKEGRKKKDTRDRQNVTSGDVYENALSNLVANGSKTASGDSVYEDTTIGAKTSKKTHRSDGLVYADLEFKTPPKGKGRNKIIGIEDRCEYTTIDLTKKAKPLPDSGDEEKKKP